MGWLYRLVFPNGKSYVGQTTRDKVTDRWRGHKFASLHRRSNSRLLYAAIRKYGWDSVEKVVLAQVLDHDLLDEGEKLFVQHYNAFAPGGYNLTRGGDRNPMSEASVRQKMSDTCSTIAHKERVSKRIKELHANPVWKKAWLARNAAGKKTWSCHPCGVERPIQSTRPSAMLVATVPRKGCIGG